MKPADQIQLTIINNTAARIPLSILGNPANLADIANQFTNYKWNITGFTFVTENRINLQYKPNSAASFLNYNVELAELTIAGVLEALNNLGIGAFYTYTSGPNTFIATDNDSYTFGLLSIYPSNNTTASYYINTIGNTGITNIDVNSVSQVSQANPAGVSADIAINGGDLVDFYGTTPNLISSLGYVMVNVIDVTAGTTLYNVQLGASVPFTFSFTAIAGHFYSLTLQN